MKKKPNFFIIGAPKCGTTALSEYLKTHPNVYFSPIKEPDYFADDFRAGNLKPGGIPINSLEKYLELFGEVEEHHQAIGEASATYLSSSVAPRNIYQFNPQGKIIVMLRNPVDLVYAYHSQIVYNLGENEPDFEKAWQLQSSRQQGKNIPPLCGNTNVLRYRKIAQIGSQLEKLFAIFPKEQVKVILFDDFKQDTAKIYNDVVNFLNLPVQNKQDFAIINSNKSHKSALIACLIQRPPKSIVNAVNALKSWLNIDSFGIMNYLIKYNSNNQKRTSLRKEFRQYLVAEYTSEVIKLEQLLEIDLSDWKQ